MRRWNLGLLPVATLLAGFVLPVTAAAAANLSCGQSVNASTTLAADIGPCPGDGLIVTGNNVVLNLGGHTVRGLGDLAADQVGVRFAGVSGAQLLNGTVRAFNTGVALENTTASTVSRIVARDNKSTGIVNHGDGILLDGSSNNQILSNESFGNGPFGGISLADGADSNLIRANYVHDNTLIRTEPAQVAPRQETYGIRLDTGASFNTIDANNILNNGSHGVNAAGFEHTGNKVTNNVVQGNGHYGILGPGDHFLISGNRVISNGFDQFEVPGQPKASADGILVFGNFGGGVGVIENNILQGNAHDGLAMRTLGFTFFGEYHPPVVDEIRGNTAVGNANNGIFIECDFVADKFPAHVCVPNPPPHEGQHLSRNRAYQNGGAKAGRTAWDLYDENPNCDHNIWRDNTGGTVNPPCTLTKS